MSQKPYRRNVGAVVFNESRQVLLGERVGYPGSLQFPQGGLDDGETPEQAARREVYEELGLRLDGAPVAEVPEWLRYDFPPDIPKKLKKYRGQEQRWFFYYWSGEVSQLDLDVHEREFSRVVWGTLDDALASIVAFKRPVYERVVSFGRQAIDVFLAGRPK